MKKTLIKAISLILSIIMLMSCVSYGTAKSIPFSDVKKGNWFYNAVEYCYENQIFSGMTQTSFAPTKTMTREMLVTALAGLSGADVSVYTETSFRDVRKGAWYAPYVEWAYQNGIVQGIGNKRFGIDKAVTRAEAVTMLYNYTAAMGYSNTHPMSQFSLAGFTDLKKTPDYSKPAFGWAVAEGIVSGITPTFLDPRGNFNRAQAAQLFMQYDKLSLPAADSYINVKLTDDSYDVFSPYDTSYSYRYGPTMITNEDGSIDSYYSGLGSGGVSASSQASGGYKEWDHITYTHIDKAGNIQPEKTVLQPTPNSYDFYSCCDPGIVYFGGYYYLGYTSTIDYAGVSNNVYVARSKSPDGPFEKWNGSGWGGRAMPIIMYHGTNLCWGAGEVAFVEIDGTLFIYYTLKGQNGFYTMAATADSTQENWPLTIVEHGPALTQGNAQSGADFKYVESQRKFIGVAIENSFARNSYIRIYQSTDGIRYTETQKIYQSVCQYAHNIGISGNKQGHIKEADSIYIGYAYANADTSKNWGQWATKMHKINLSATQNPLTTDSGKNQFCQFDITPEQEWRTIAISTLPHHFNLNEGATAEIDLRKINSRYNRRQVTEADKVSFEIEDSTIISIDGFTVTALKEGSTDVTATYDGCSITFPVRVYPGGYDLSNPQITEFLPLKEDYIIGAGEFYPSQIRTYINCDGLIWGEAYNDTRARAVFHADDYPITYSGYDSDILYVNHDGLLTGIKPGVTEVTVSLDDHSYTVEVVVK